MNYVKLNRRSGILTISSVFLLLIAGGVVRSTGSGMGCPDWPRCYGKVFPPLCSCELPEGYQQIYVEKRIQKVERFAGLLNALGMPRQAQILLSDPNVLKPEEFNPLKAWTEYINRIIGVLSGLFSLIFFLSLMKLRRYISRTKFWSGVAGFIMMLFNAWFGSIVVATNLFPVTISIHYIAAYAVLALFMLSIINTRVDQANGALWKFRYYFVFFLLLSLIQLVYGTGLREVSDRAISLNTLHLQDGSVNFDFLGRVFNIHWLMALGLIGISLIPVLILRKKIEWKWYRLLLACSATLVLQYISGVVNLRYVFPLISQVSHIFFAGIIFGITLYICISVFRAPKNISNH